MHTTTHLPVTDRQLHVLAEVLAHEERSEAADCLGITEDTLRNHLTDCYRRLDTDSLIGAAKAVGWLWVIPRH